ncbi:MAG: NHL repeat-containing protein, partial [Deferrisomatales bacterium]|nr:NHL repeat-containing protein [Deferrisomatales bacterium]
MGRRPRLRSHRSHRRTKLKRFCSRSSPSRLALLLGALLATAGLQGPGADAATPEWHQRELFGDHGPARNELREPVAVALLGEGSVAVLERDKGSLVVFDDRGRYLRTLGGPGGVGGFDLRRPEGLAADLEENLWVADTGNHRLLVVKPDGTRVATYGSLGSSGDRLREPRDVTFDRAGRVYVADTGNERVQVLRASNGAVVDSWASRTGGRRGHLNRPVALAYSGQDSGGIWVLNKDAGRRLEFFDLEGNWQKGLDVPAAVQDEMELADVVVEPGLYRMFL